MDFRTTTGWTSFYWWLSARANARTNARFRKSWKILKVMFFVFDFLFFDKKIGQLILSSPISLEEWLDDEIRYHNHIPGDVVAQLLTPEPNHRLLLLAPALRLHNCTETGVWYIHLGRRFLRDHTNMARWFTTKLVITVYRVFCQTWDVCKTHVVPFANKVGSISTTCTWLNFCQISNLCCRNFLCFLSHFVAWIWKWPNRSSNEDMALSVRFHDSKKEVEVKGFESIMASRNLTTKVLIPSSSTVNHNEREFQVKLWDLVDFTRCDESLVATLPKPSKFSKAAQVLCLRILFVLLFSSSQAFQEPAKSIKNMSCKVQQSRILIGGTTTTSCCLWCSIAGSERVPISDLGAILMKIIPKKDGVG